MNTKRPTRKLICHALLDFLEDKPFEAATITEITNRAGVSRTSFYRNFDSVYDALMTLEESFIEALPSVQENAAVYNQWMQRSQGNLGDVPSSSGLQSTEVLDAEDIPRAYKILSGPNGDPLFKEHFHSRIYNTTRQVLALRLGEGEDVDFMAEYLAASQMSTVRWLAVHGDELDQERFLSLATAMHIHASRAIIDAQQRLNIDIRASGADA